MRTRSITEPSGDAWSRELRPERHRERVLTVLDDRELPVSLSDLADAVLEHAGPMSPLATQEDAESVRVRLHHVDLPKLADSGAIEYDQENNVVSHAARRQDD